MRRDMAVGPGAVWVWTLGLLGVGEAWGGDRPEESASTPTASRPVDGIRDNSFLVEEAYNQEAGVVQHIWTARFAADHRGEANGRSWDLSFTQEWPVFEQTHQLSYTVPYSFLDENAENESGIGDFLINYRYQALMDEGATPAFSPRLSLVLPSGDDERGFGTGEVGYQVNLPVSKTISDRAYVNFNAGLTYHPDVVLKLSDGRRAESRDLLSFNVGASGIYAVTDTVHLMLEVAWNSSEGLEERQPRGRRRRPDARRDRVEEVVISPGVRWAINAPGDLQIVPGVAFPIGLSEAAPDYGVFFYLSIEHPFLASAP